MTVFARRQVNCIPKKVIRLNGIEITWETERARHGSALKQTSLEGLFALLSEVEAGERENKDKFSQTRRY